MIESGEVRGVRAVCETVPFFRSVSFGVWVFAGSRDEPSERAGALHFIEHLAFKGAAGRDAASIAAEIDELGGHIDAFTSREVTCFSGHVVGERLEEAFALVADIALRSTFPEAEVELERQVILEEMRQVEDTPAERIHDQIYPARWGAHPLGRLITGTAETVNGLTRDGLLELRAGLYTAPRILVTACGAVTLDRMVKLINACFGPLPSGEPGRAAAAPMEQRGLTVASKPLEQTSLMIGMKGLSALDERRHELLLLNMILGGGVSSRLFQSVRERHGLAYTIYSFFDQYFDAGLTGVYAACTPAALGKLWALTRAEIERLAGEPVSAAELARAKRQSVDNIIMAYESLGARMSQIASQMLYHGRVFGKEEMIERVNRVTAENIRDLAGQLFGDPRDYTLIALGPLDGDAAARALQ